MPAPYYPDVLDHIFPLAMDLASEFSDSISDFDSCMGPNSEKSLVGPDPSARGRLNRSQRAASLGTQQGTHVSNNGLAMLIPDDNPKGSMLIPKQHVAKAQLLDHLFQWPPDFPLDLQYAASASIPDTVSVRKDRLAKAQRIGELADKADILDKRMLKRVKVAAGKARLGLLTVLAFILHWPD